MIYKQLESLILASNSPRRRAMLSEAGLQYDTIVSNVDETQIAKESPEAMVKRLALAKAKVVSEKNPNKWVLGADTDVSIEGDILGKPADAEDAVRLLGKIQGRVHEVWGAFALLNFSRKISHVESHRSFVELNSMDEKLMRSYAATGEPMDKAGAYAVQGLGSQFIARIDGSYTNVVGLNLSAVMAALRKYGVIA